MKSRLNNSLHKSTVLLLYIRDSLNYLDDPFLHHLFSNYQIIKHNNAKCKWNSIKAHLEGKERRSTPIPVGVRATGNSFLEDRSEKFSVQVMDVPAPCTSEEARARWNQKANI